MAVKGFTLFGIHHEGMERGQSIPVIGDFIRFTFVENPGMAFGLDFGAPLLLGLFSIGAAIFLVYLLRKAHDTKIGGFHYALSMILAGAVGNLIDRVFYGVFYDYASLFHGKVVDFIDVDIPDNLFGLSLDRFYVFNIADSAVSVGIILLLIFYPKYERMMKERKGVGAEEAEGEDFEVDGEMDYDEGIDTMADDTLIHQTRFQQSATESGDQQDDNKSIKDSGDHKSHGNDSTKPSHTNDDSKSDSSSGHHSSRSHDSDSTSSSGGGWWSSHFGSSDSGSGSDSGSSDSGGWSDSGGSDSSSFD
ncbi:MAG: signal peptidase II [Ignavibacteriae bacterium]|nr:signal peptidase II [Ignavibacteriota bacterium]MCB9216455.1 signal peptidase II [Ignavibacteria bacterium]